MSVLLRRFLGLSLLFIAGISHAQVTVEDGYAALDRAMKGLQTLQSEFTQTVQDSRGQTVEQSKGTLAIKKPGKFRWDYAKPHEQHIISDGKRIWLYDPELEQVTVRRAELSLNGTPAMLLSGEGDVRQSFEVEHVEQRAGMVIVNLSPKRADTDFKLVQLGIRGDQLAAMSLTDKLGQNTLLEFRNYRRNPALKDAQFTFTSPPNVDVIDNTAGQ